MTVKTNAKDIHPATLSTLANSQGQVFWQGVINKIDYYAYSFVRLDNEKKLRMFSYSMNDECYFEY